MAAPTRLVLALLLIPDVVSRANGDDGAPADAQPEDSICQGGPRLLSFAFGTSPSDSDAGGIDVWNEGWKASAPVRVSMSSPVWWATQIDGVGLALCEDKGLQIWRLGANTSVDVSLAPLSTPVGAIYHDGKLWVACFGSWPAPEGDSGVAVVDVASGSLINTYPFSASGDPDDVASHVHNIYLFDWNDHLEMFVAVLGNPWAEPPVPGKGLVHFNQFSGNFKESTSERLNVRSAVQHSESTFFVLTQEPGGVATKLASLRKLEDDSLLVEAVAELPPHDSEGPDIGGGADVVLGLEPYSVWCTDRNAGTQKGKLYYYEYRSNDGNDERQFTEALFTYETGVNPRYMTVLSTPADNGTVVVCNQGDATLSVYPGLALQPTDAVEPSEIPTVDVVAFFLQGNSSDLCDHQESWYHWPWAIIKLASTALVVALGTVAVCVLLIKRRADEEDDSEESDGKDSAPLRE